MVCRLRSAFVASCCTRQIMQPFTPRRTGPRQKNLTLSAKEYDKVRANITPDRLYQPNDDAQITGTIASVRKSRQFFDDDDDIDSQIRSSRDSRGKNNDLI
jgi:hypothetical protein